VRLYGQLHPQTAQSARELHDEQRTRKLHRSTGINADKTVLLFPVQETRICFLFGNGHTIRQLLPSDIIFEHFVEL